MPSSPSSRGAFGIADVERLAGGLRDAIRGSVELRQETLEVVLAVLLGGGHLLIEDRPGVGKTQLARSLAAAIGGRFQRVQGTVDLLPMDVIGATVWHASAERFEFHPGPVFTNVLLVDELNRTTPKTQSGLLEVMEERQATVDGLSYDLPRPFLVVATQNPDAAGDGTYPLPSAQMDRFLARVSLGYPAPHQEVALLRERPSAPASPVTDPAELERAQDAVQRVGATDALLEYVVSLLGLTRGHPLAATGASPRAGLGLLRAARARAAIQGREYVLPDDVQALAGPVLAHRIAAVDGAPQDAGAQVVAEALARARAR